MIERTKNRIRTVAERPYNVPGKGESVSSPFFHVKMGNFDGWIFRWIFKVDIHFDITGYSHLGYFRGMIERGESTDFLR